MHEMAIVESMVEAAVEHARGARVKRLKVEIGKLSTVLPDAVRFCFDLAIEGTDLEGAALEIVEIDGLARCRGCGGSVVLERPLGVCACGGIELEWTSGMGVQIVEMEVL
jgi:hydrogenase nickel incorporation protein HypA/HybF